MSESAAQGASNAVSVGRGALVIAAGKAWFMVTGAAVNFGLGSLLGALEYGNYGVAVRWVSLLNMMLVQGLLQGVSRAVARQQDAAGTLWKQARGTVVALSAGAGLAVVALAWPLSAVLGDTRLAVLLGAGALITASYGVYAAQVGVLNGLQRFRQQGLVDMAFSTGKMVFILGAAALGTGALGSLLGFGVSALLMATAVGFLVRGVPAQPAAERLQPGQLLRFGGAVMAYQALLNLLMFVDLGFVRRAVATQALSEGAAGFYTAAINLAQVPYLGCTAVTFVVFPLLGQAGDHDPDRSRAMVKQALRYALLIGGPAAGAIMGAAPGVLTAVFPAPYRAAAPALALLAPAYLCTALASVTCTMLNALGRPMASARAVTAGVVVSAALAWVLVDPLGLVGGAVAASAGMVTLLGLSGWLLHATGRAEVPWGALGRHAVAMMVVGAVGALVTWPEGSTTARLVGLGGAVGVGLLYVVVLVVTGEVGRAEWDLLRRVVGGRAGGARPAGAGGA